MAEANTDFSEVHARLAGKIRKEQRPESYLLVDCSKQTIQLCANGRVLQRYIISSAKNGLGGACGSLKTPSGLHQISHIIGEGASSGLLFKGRVAQPICVPIETQACSTGVDAITSRILRLDGLEEGLNRGEGCDSFSRFIYLHGTSEEGLLGVPVSHGCIRLANADVIALAALVQERALVFVF